MVLDEQALTALQAQVAGLAATNAAREQNERDLRRVLDEQKAALEAANRRAEELQVQLSSARTMQLPPPTPADGYQQLLKSQLEILNTEIGGEDTWVTIVAKDLKKKKPKDAKGDVIVDLNPLRVMNPNVIFVPTAILALVAMDDKNCEQLMLKIEGRYNFSHELVEELGFCFLPCRRC